MPKNNKEGFLENSGIQVLLITATSYAVAYIFEYAYLNHFNVSYKFIEVNVITLIVSIALLSYGFFMIDHIKVAMIEMTDGIKRESIKREMRRVVGMAIASVISALVYYGMGGHNWLTMAGIICLLLLTFEIDFIFNLIRYRNLDKALEKAQKSREEDLNKPYKTLAERNAYYIYLLTLVFAIALGTGKYFASSQNGLYVISAQNDSSRLLIKNYGERYILKDFNTVSRQFEDGFYIMEMNDTLELKKRVQIKE